MRDLSRVSPRLCRGLSQSTVRLLLGEPEPEAQVQKTPKPAPSSPKKQADSTKNQIKKRLGSSAKKPLKRG